MSAAMIVLSIVLSAIVLALLVMIPITYVKQRRAWNRGVSKKSNMPWVQFGKTVSGSRGYTDKCGNHCWIFFNVDRP